MAGLRATMQAARLGMLEAQTSLAGLGAMGFGVHQTALSARAPEGWLQEDPAAKAYATAREALNGRRYEAAASAFATLRKDYPQSGYVPDSYYWQAFALYRQGGRATCVPPWTCCPRSSSATRRPAPATTRTSSASGWKASWPAWATPVRRGRSPSRPNSRAGRIRSCAPRR